MHDGYEWMWGMHWGWWIFWIAFVLIIVLLFWRGLSGPNAPPSRQTETPLEVLQRRYADGEITTEEYEERKARLEDST
jgi:putative membrane protein